MKIDRLEDHEAYRTIFKASNGNVPEVVMQNYLLYSQALSLKRIADMFGRLMVDYDRRQSDG